MWKIVGIVKLISYIFLYVKGFHGVEKFPFKLYVTA